MLRWSCFANAQKMLQRWVKVHCTLHPNAVDKNKEKSPILSFKPSVLALKWSPSIHLVLKLSIDFDCLFIPSREYSFIVIHSSCYRSTDHSKKSAYNGPTNHIVKDFCTSCFSSIYTKKRGPFQILSSFHLHTRHPFRNEFFYRKYLMGYNLADLQSVRRRGQIGGKTPFLAKFRV